MTTVVKIGGSLLRMHQLGAKLRTWLETLPTKKTFLLVGGGEIANVIRDLDEVHKFGDDVSHWLAVRAMSINAQFLASLLPRSVIVGSLSRCDEAWNEQQTPILDPWPFLQNDEANADHLPHSWAVTSDSIAAHIAVRLGAKELVLLKSCSPQHGGSWQDMATDGLVDAWFPRLAERIPSVRIVNFRALGCERFSSAASS